MRRRGFSLLEVMVALAIFGLMISGILAAQAGLAASNKKAANMGQALNLGRCKMTEVEEKLLRDGYPEIDAINTEIACCDTVDPAPFSCDSKVEKVTMPDLPASTSGDGGTGGLPPGISAMMGGADGGGPNTAAMDFDAGLQGLGAQVQGQTGGGGSEGLLNMVMGLVYPSMKPMMEASIRRITITVHWKEGPNPQEFTIVQYVTNPQRGGFIGASPMSSGAPASTLAPAPVGATPIVPFGGAAGAGR